MIRGGIYLAIMSGDYGKPRPVVVVQRNDVNETHDSIVVCPITSHLFNAPLIRLDIEPTSGNGLRLPSQIMVDKVAAIKRERFRDRIGHVHDELLLQISRSLTLWLGL